MIHQKGTIRILLIVCALMLLVTTVHADYIFPALTHVYFERDGEPYHGSVQYSVKCYGYSFTYPFKEKTAGTYQPEIVFQYSASCPEYGCPIYQPYYLKYAHIDWCDLHGETGGYSFTLQNFSDKPYSQCDRVWRRVLLKTGDRREFYYPSPEYELCSKLEYSLRGDSSVSRNWTVEHALFSDKISQANWTSIIVLQGLIPLYYSPSSAHNTRITIDDVPQNLDQYINYLETCDPVTDPQCGGWTINGKPLKQYSEYRPLKQNASHIKAHPCDTFLIRTDPGLIMPFTREDPWQHICWGACNVTEELCEARFMIPSGSPTLQKIPDTIPTNRSPVESLYCNIVELLGGRCG